MSDLFAVEGAKIYLGGVLALKKADFVPADFDSQTWVEIDGWETCGAMGDASEMMATQLINRKRDVNQKGTRNANAMQNQFAILPDDAGQIALRAADLTRFNYAIRIVWDDAPASGTPSETLFIALVHSTGEVGGGANTIRMLSSTFQPNSNFVQIDAAA